MRGEPNYLYLVLAQFTAIVIVTAAAPLSVLGISGVVASAAALIATAYLVTEQRRLVVLAVALGASALLPLAWVAVRPHDLPASLANALYAIDLVVWILFTLTTTVMVFRGIMTARRVRANEIYGAIYVYLLIGVLFAQGYQLLLAVAPDALYFDPARFAALEAIGSGDRVRGAGNLVYYSFVTLGTVGYGDVTPASPLARALSLVESVIGVMYVATMIARFVSIQTSRGPRDSETI